MPACAFSLSRSLIDFDWEGGGVDVLAAEEPPVAPNDIFQISSNPPPEDDGLAETDGVLGVAVAPGADRVGCKAGEEKR